MLAANLLNCNKRLEKRARICCGFTLVELLVVISIIALLLSILMPSLQKAREQSRRVLCGANEKQIATSFITYSMEYDGRLVHDRGIRTDKLGRQTITAGNKQATRPWDAAIAPQWQTKGTDSAKKVIMCPSDTYPRNAPPLSNSEWYTGGSALKRSYAPNPTLYNGLWRYMPKALWGNGTGVPVKITQVRRVGNVMLLGESHKGANWANNSDSYGCVQGTSLWEVLGTFGNCEVPWAKRSPIGNDTAWNTVHKGGGNFAFVDGHVRWCGAVNGEDYYDGQPFSGIKYPLDWQWE